LVGEVKMLLRRRCSSALSRAARPARLLPVAVVAVMVIVIGLLVAPAGPVAAETIELTNGAMVRGKILVQKTDRIVVDLGFQVMEIPLDEVERVTDETGETGEGSSLVRSVDIYQIDSGREALSVKENMARCAEAVVQVRTPIALGSGFVIHSSGYVITNQHVVSGEHKLSITVFRQAENELEKVQFQKVRIVAMNPSLDLALLKIEDLDGQELRTVPLGDSAMLRQGQAVFAVGSPLGLDRSVSQGIVSLTNRVLSGSIYVQTTTEINPGNSGGPLFNLRGEVIGVNDLKLVGVGLEGLNFAIPVNGLKEFLANRSAFAFDPRNPNAGFRYNDPPRIDDSQRESQRDNETPSDATVAPPAGGVDS